MYLKLTSDTEQNHILLEPCYTAINKKQFNIYLDFIATVYCGNSLNVYLILAVVVAVWHCNGHQNDEHLSK
jgi:hypothetical protein